MFEDVVVSETGLLLLNGFRYSMMYSNRRRSLDMSLALTFHSRNAHVFSLIAALGRH